MKIESSMNKVRGVLNSLVFGTQISKSSAQLDASKPLVIPAGSDSMHNIGQYFISSSFLLSSSAPPLLILSCLLYSSSSTSHVLTSSSSSSSSFSSSASSSTHHSPLYLLFLSSIPLLSLSCSPLSSVPHSPAPSPLPLLPPPLLPFYSPPLLILLYSSSHRPVLLPLSTLLPLLSVPFLSCFIPIIGLFTASYFLASSSSILYHLLLRIAAMCN